MLWIWLQFTRLLLSNSLASIVFKSRAWKCPNLLWFESEKYSFKIRSISRKAQLVSHGHKTLVSFTTREYK